MARSCFDINWSGHLGIEKTKDRVLQNYYWPGVFKDATDYCRSCPGINFKQSGKVTDLDHEVEFGNRKPRRVLHVNMLTKWHARKINVFLAVRIDRISDQDDKVYVYPIGGSQSWHDVHVNASLSDDQYQDANAILLPDSTSLSVRR